MAEVFDITGRMFERLWTHYQASANARLAASDAELADIERERKRLLKRIVDTQVDAVVTALGTGIGTGMVELDGIEPSTSCMPCKRSPS